MSPTSLAWTIRVFVVLFSLPKGDDHTSSCGEAQLLLRNTLGLSEDEIEKTLFSAQNNNGRWADRRVDSMV